MAARNMRSDCAVGNRQVQAAECAPLLIDPIWRNFGLRPRGVRAGGFDLLPIIAQALHMGDECHSRHKAASALFTNLVAPYVAALAEAEGLPAHAESVRMRGRK